MEYITQYKHTLRNKPFAGLYGTVVLLAEPESEARAFYTKQMANMDMQVIAYDNLPAILAHMQSPQADSTPDIIIVNPSTDLKSSLNFLKAFRKEFPTLPVITMALTMPDTSIDAIMEAGVSLHINRGLTRPRDLFLAIEQVLPVK